MLEGIGGVAWDDIETPRLLACASVIGRDVPAYAVLASPISDNDLALGNSRRARNCVGLIRIGRASLPDAFARFRVQPDEPSIKRGENEFPFPERGPAIYYVATASPPPLARHFGIVGPDGLACFRVERHDDTPGQGDKHDAVNDDGRRFMPSTKSGFDGPHKPHVADIFFVDLVQWRKALFRESSPMGEPIALFGIGVSYAVGINIQIGLTDAILRNRLMRNQQRHYACAHACGCR